jgi:signal transduction histidine kinase
MSDHAPSARDAYAQLLSLAVHEFRTPTSVVGGYLRMLQSGVAGALSDAQRKMIGEAEKSCARIATLIGEMSDISKIDGETVVLSETDFDLFPLIDDLASDMHDADNREVQLQVRGAAEGALVTGDRTRLASAFRVLLQAVLREQPSATTVVVDRRLEGDIETSRAIILIARDDKVQQTYDAAPRPLDELRGGLGLGMPLARRVIERYGGRTWTPDLAEGGVGERAGIVVSLPLRPTGVEDR